jgi:alanine dehydrogenase
MRILFDADVERAMSMASVFDPLAAVYDSVRAGTAGSAPRLTSSTPTGWVRLMTAYDEVTGFSVAKVFNLARGTGVRYVLLLHRLTDGELVAMIDGRRISGLRTGGMSGQVLRQLGVGSVRGDVAILGSGHQAAMQLEAVAAVLPVRRVRVFSPTAANREAFAVRMSRQLGLRVEASSTPEGACDGAEIVVLATNSTAGEPILRNAWLAPRSVILGIGSTRPTSVELDADTLAATQWVVVDTVHALEEAGDLHEALAAGALDVERVRSLESAGPPTADEWTEGHLVFKSVGSAVQDLALAVRCYLDAEVADAGAVVPPVASLKAAIGGSVTTG